MKQRNHQDPPPQYEEIVEDIRRKLSENKANVRFIMDCSDSMKGFYESGLMNNLLIKIVFLGCFLDPDQIIEIIPFGSFCSPKMELSVSIMNEQFSRGENVALGIFRSHKHGRTTNYADVLNVARESGSKKVPYINKYLDRINPSDTPYLNFFLTDGECDQEKQSEFKESFRNSSFEAQFWKTICLIPNPAKQMDLIKYLNDNMDDIKLWDGNRNRPAIDEFYIDNADVMFVDPNNNLGPATTVQLKVGDSQIMKNITIKKIQNLNASDLLEEFPEWYKEAYELGLHNQIPRFKIDEEDQAKSGREARLHKADKRLPSVNHCLDCSIL